MMDTPKSSTIEIMQLSDKPPTNLRWLVKEYGRTGTWYRKGTYWNNAVLQHSWHDLDGKKHWVDVPIIIEKDV